MIKTIGGDRLGNGKKIKVDMHNWGRSTHNQSRIWRSTAGVGYGIPCFIEIGTNGTTFDIDINALGHTIPTISPLFGSFKMQVDMFACPFRLYQGLLHNNATNIGMNMAQVLFPNFTLEHKNKKMSTNSLLGYLGVKGTNNEENNFNAVPVFAYYDIFKNYYCNKQEEYAKVITTEKSIADIRIKKAIIYNKQETTTTRNQKNNETKETTETINLSNENQRREIATSRTRLNEKEIIFKGIGDQGNNMYAIDQDIAYNDLGTNENFKAGKTLEIQLESKYGNQLHGNGLPTPNFTMETIYIDWGEDFSIELNVKNNKKGTFNTINSTQKKYKYEYDEVNKILYITNLNDDTFNDRDEFEITFEGFQNNFSIKDFPLENLDEARRRILQKTSLTQRITINNDFYNGNNKLLPYSSILESIEGDYKYLDKQGLMLKTYQNDIFNCWLSTEFVDLINNISSVATDENGAFNIDSFILAKKVYNMLNRIAISGGTYEDWQEANWGEDAIQRAESPIYIGGMSCDIEFEEIVSTASTEEQPLATLGGKGIMNNKKGGSIIYKCQEPCIIMGILSITPRVDYHQGNKWYMTNLDNMDNLHKPGLDGTGFQNLIANNVHWKASRNQALAKQPAWIEYTTAVNEVFGQFAKDEEFDPEDNLSQMVLRRNYEVNEQGQITDFTTYIDPSKFNYAFAVNDLKSENFWIQLGFKCESRRKMAATEIPNL